MPQPPLVSMDPMGKPGTLPPITAPLAGYVAVSTAAAAAVSGIAANVVMGWRAGGLLRSSGECSCMCVMRVCMGRVGCGASLSGVQETKFLVLKGLAMPRGRALGCGGAPCCMLACAPSPQTLLPAHAAATRGWSVCPGPRRRPARRPRPRPPCPTSPPPSPPSTASWSPSGRAACARCGLGGVATALWQATAWGRGGGQPCRSAHFWSARLLLLSVAILILML